MKLSRHPGAGILNRLQLKKTLDKMKEQGKTVVFTNGCFDILHVGHVRYLYQAASFGDILVVGINSDSSVRALKGPGRPVNSQENRAEVLSALEMVDYVTIFDESTPEALISRLKPHIHVKGGDYEKSQLPEAALVESYGGRVEIVSLVKGASTTGTIGRILNSGKAGPSDA